MTHDELLAKIDKDFGYEGFTKEIIDGISIASYKALRAVVELHKPIGSHDVCAGCETKFYPCPTIQAIEKELK